VNEISDAMTKAATRVALFGVLVLAVGCSSGPKANIVAYSAVDGCQPVGSVTDEHLDDLQEKAAKKGGNPVVLIGESREVRGYVPGLWAPEPVLRDRTIGDVYRCDRGPVEKTWVKRGSTAQEFQRDHYECTRNNQPSAFVGSGTLGIVGAARNQNDLYKVCMRVRSWELDPKR
jgi:hypothetical protein